MARNNHHNEILSYIDKYGIYDKDSTKPKKACRKKPHYEKVKKGLRKVVDLHGMIQDEAVFSLRKSFLECKRKGINSILIIHGIGYNSNPAEGPILKKTVHAMLEHEFCNDIKEFRTALLKDGGEGATIVKLKY